MLLTPAPIVCLTPVDGGTDMSLMSRMYAAVVEEAERSAWGKESPETVVCAVQAANSLLAKNPIAADETPEAWAKRVLAPFADRPWLVVVQMLDMVVGG